MTYRLPAFGGLILALSYKVTTDFLGRVWVTHTLTNLAALKHFGGPRGAPANDNYEDRRAG